MSNLPKGWEEVTLSEVCTKIQDGNYGTFYPKSHEFLESGIPFLTSKAIGSNGILIPSKIDYISPKKHAELKKAHLKLNDILFTNRGANVGAIGIVEENISHGNIGPQLTLLRANEKITPNFLLYSMRSSLVQKQIESNDSGSAMNFFGIKETSKFKLYLPPLEEQKKIADILSTVDKKIAFVEENINATEELKKGLMQKLLTEGIGHTEFKDSELGRIPESWEVTELIKICEDNKRAIVDGPFGSNLKTIHFREQGIPVIQSNFVTSGKFNAKEYVYVDEDKFNSEIRSKVVGGDIVMAKIGANCGTSAIIPINHPVSLLSGNSIKVSIDLNKASVVFVDFIFKNMYSRTNFAELKSIGAQPAISMPLLKKLKIPKPPLEEQKQIAEIISTVDNKLENLKEKKQYFEELKKGLMQKLLTGEVRV